MRVIVLRYTLVSSVLIGALFFYSADNPPTIEREEDSVLIRDQAEVWKIVNSQCTMCHSSNLIAQHRLDRESWLKSIQRMQRDEGLWPLNEYLEPILNYLSDNYGPQENETKPRVRRRNLNQPPLDLAHTEKTTPAQSDNIPPSNE